MALQMVNSFQPLAAETDWAELEPYLAGLDVSEALEDFGRLADRVLSAPSRFSASQPRPQPAAATFDEHRYQQHRNGSLYSSPSPSSCLTDESELSPHSPGTASLYSTATTTSTYQSVASLQWSQPASPVTSEHPFSCNSSSAFSSPSPHSYSSSSSSASSAAGSVCGDSDDSQHRRLSSRSWRSQSGASKRSDRKRQNASAAERYRRKMRGCQYSLEEELERERERNSKLLQSFEAKLELYREFANLLAANTCDPSRDLDLARLGSNSLENILERICPAEVLAHNEQQRLELERLQEHFKRVLSVAQFCR